MWKKIVVIILLLTVLSSTTFPFIGVMGNNNTSVQLDPSTITIPEIGKTFSVNATITNVTGICAWDIELYYRNSILICIDANEGPFLQTGGNTMWAQNITNTYNSTHGRVFIGCSLLGQVPGVNGSGVLAAITFQTQDGGDTLLHFDSTRLYDCGMPPQPIEHKAIDGSVHVGIHEVAVTDIVPYKTVITPGCSVNITLTVENQGEFTETFNVTVYANTTIIDTLLNTSLTSGNSTTITFAWNTTGVAKGNYALSAIATLSGEIYNTLVDGWIVVTILGDVNGDGWVEIMDFWVLSQASGSSPGDSNWNPNGDIYPPPDGDGIIEIMDFWLVSQHVGEHDC
jgi:hypothetical protein